MGDLRWDGYGAGVGIVITIFIGDTDGGAIAVFVVVNAVDFEVVGTGGEGCDG